MQSESHVVPCLLYVFVEARGIVPLLLAAVVMDATIPSNEVCRCASLMVVSRMAHIDCLQSHQTYG
jgi:hypothetical protein